MFGSIILKLFHFVKSVLAICKLYHYLKIIISLAINIRHNLTNFRRVMNFLTGAIKFSEIYIMLQTIHFN